MVQKAGPTPRGRATVAPRESSLGVFKNLVEHSAIVEMRQLHPFPATEIAVDGEERDVGELALVTSRDLGVAWPVIVFRNDLLGFRRVEVAQIRLGHLAGA